MGNTLVPAILARYMAKQGPKRPKTAFLGHKRVWWLQTGGTKWNKGGTSQGTSPVMHWNRFWDQGCPWGAPGATRSAYGPKRLFLAVLDALGALWRTHMALPDQRNGFNASPGMCPDLFHPCSTLFHQFGATRSAYGRKRPFLAVLDPVWGPSGAPL